MQIWYGCQLTVDVMYISITKYWMHLPRTFSQKRTTECNFAGCSEFARARVCVCVFILLVLVLHNKILKNVTSLMFSILRTCICPFTRSKTFVLLKLNLVEIHNVYTHRSLFWLSLSVNGFSVTFVIRMQNFAMIASHMYVYWLLFGI